MMGVARYGVPWDGVEAFSRHDESFAGSASGKPPCPLMARGNTPLHWLSLGGFS